MASSCQLATAISEKKYCSKKCASLCDEMRKKNEIGFGAALALASLAWQDDLENRMYQKHQFLQCKINFYFLNLNFYNEFESAGFSEPAPAS